MGSVLDRYTKNKVPLIGNVMQKPNVAYSSWMMFIFLIELNVSHTHASSCTCDMNDHTKHSTDRNNWPRIDYVKSVIVNQLSYSIWQNVFTLLKRTKSGIIEKNSVYQPNAGSKCIFHIAQCQFHIGFYKFNGFLMSKIVRLQRKNRKQRGCYFPLRKRKPSINFHPNFPS